MKTEVLDIRPTEFAFANAPTDCDICGIKIAVGAPYKVTRTLQAANGVYEVHTTVECLRPCSLTKTTVLSDNEQPGFTFHHSWDDMPEFADEEQAKLKIVSLRGNEWVATGYSHIREFQGKSKALGFVVFNAEQVQKKIFARNYENDDNRGLYEGWKTPAGLWVRKYVKAAQGISAGQWTMPLNCLAIKKPENGKAATK